MTPLHCTLLYIRSVLVVCVQWLVYRNTVPRYETIRHTYARPRSVSRSSFTKSTLLGLKKNTVVSHKIIIEYDNYIAHHKKSNFFRCITWIKLIIIFGSLYSSFLSPVTIGLLITRHYLWMVLLPQFFLPKFDWTKESKIETKLIIIIIITWMNTLFRQPVVLKKITIKSLIVQTYYL